MVKGETVPRQTAYAAITTHNANGEGWNIVTLGYPGQSSDSVKYRAETLICGDQWDRAKNTYVDTELKNLRVLAQSRLPESLLRAYYEDMADE